MKKVLIVICKFIRGIFRFIFFVIVGLICKLIAKINHEEGKEKQITIKKAKRIRRLTNFKLKMLKHFPILMNFFGEKKYLEYLKQKLNYGV